MERTEKKGTVNLGRTTCFAAATAFLAAVALSLFAGDGLAQQGSCERASRLAWHGCLTDAREDLYIELGKCFTLSDQDERKECEKDVWEDFDESKDMCGARFEARQEVCDMLGGVTFQPDIHPSDFIDPETAGESDLNPYFPLVPGNVWVYEGMTDEGLETITVTVTEEIKEIEYPEDSGLIFKCRVVRDVVTMDDELVEDTVDWYATDREANLWYFGEIAKNYEDGELTDLDGSWKAGRDMAAPGIVIASAPFPGDVYRQEFLLGQAEDMAKVATVGSASVSVPAGDFSTDVLETEEWTPIEPDVLEYKYYAPGVGMVLELNPETGERVELVQMTGSQFLP